jgi:hypothetical protein
MKNYKIFKILIGIVSLGLIIKLFTIVLIEPWAERKLVTVLNKTNSNYPAKIDNVHILLLSSGIELNGISIKTREESRGNLILNCEIEFVKITGVRLLKAIFKKSIQIGSVSISGAGLRVRHSLQGKAIQPMVSPVKITISRIILERTAIEVETTSTSEYYSAKEIGIELNDLLIRKKDTISYGIIKKIEFVADQLNYVSADSMYSVSAGGIAFSVGSNTLKINNLAVLPNYKDYDFTSRYEFQKNRLEADLANICFYDFNPVEYLISRSLKSSYIEIGNMDLNVFRDKRRKFRHKKMSTFQDLIYNYPGVLKIDSIGLIAGNIFYTEHAPEANEPGRLSFNEISARIFNLTNDTGNVTKGSNLILVSDARLMGKGRMTVLLKSKLFDRQNTFSLSGTLTDLEAKELNPFLEKVSFVYATSGLLDDMKFSFIADNTNATGKMTLLYKDLNITVKNKKTDDTTAFIERFISLIVNKKVLDSNPIPGEAVREGVISYDRDPEKFLFSYCARSILTGLKSSITKNSRKKNK